MSSGTRLQRDAFFSLYTLPCELQLCIMAILNPIDATCFGLTCKKMYKVYRTLHSSVPLTIGSPASPTPVIKRSGCKYCVPVRYYPAHCELRHHLGEWLPPDLKYCTSCDIFTPSLAYSEKRPWRRFCISCGEDLESQQVRCRQRLITVCAQGGRKWPKYYGEGEVIDEEQ